MKAVSLGIIMAVTATVAHAQDMAEMISRYRREHGLSTVKIDPQLTAIAERQAKAMAASGTLDHDVAGSFSSRISGLRTTVAAENIAAGPKTWTEAFRMWQTSPGHNANLLQSRADSIGVAVVRNDQTRYKTYWAMVIAERTPEKPPKTPKASPKGTEAKVTAQQPALERPIGAAGSESPLTAVKNFFCKYVC